MTADVITYSTEQLTTWRHDVLTKTRMSFEELEAREASGALTVEEANALATIRGIDFLLS